MKPIIIFVFALAGVLNNTCQSQPPRTDEFALHSNGLIYSPEDMKILGHMVDSLNLRFKSCRLDRTHFSLPQINIWKVTLSSKSNDLKDVQEDMKAGKDLQFIRQKYGEFITALKLEATVVSIRISNEKPYTLSGNPSTGYSEYDYEKKPFSNKPWEIKYTGNKELGYALDCKYFSPREQQQIPDEYARLIQYVDCMIDTNTTVMLGDYDYEYNNFERDNATVKKVHDYLNQQMGVKKSKGDSFEFDYLTMTKIAYAKNNLAKHEHFKRLVLDAVEECIRKNRGSDGIEELSEMYVSKSKLLDMKRRRFVMGSCSMDQSPRLHALNIAMLAAQTHSWDIFLRAHLDIMNDRFARVSDGSYAWGRRQTYLKELEELGLHVADLMIGLTLRSQNTSDNHYYGTVWRLGKALAESEDRLNFEKKLIAMVKDEKLDEFNRGLLFILYHSYLNHLELKKERAEKVKALQANVSGFPASLKSAIAEMKIQE